METRAAQHAAASGDLLVRIRAIRSRMPGANSEGFVKPSASELSEWRGVVALLATGDYDGAKSRLVASSLPYQLSRFIDTGFENRNLWALEENVPIRKGWGDLYLNPAPATDLGIEAPHPLFDADTEVEGADIFRGAAARFLLIAGTHRCANAEASPCSGSTSACGDGRFHVSDAGHGTTSPFEAAHEVFVGRFPSIVTVSLHGNGDSSCEDVFLGNGVTGNPSPLVVDLRDRLVARGNLTIGLAGE